MLGKGNENACVKFRNVTMGKKVKQVVPDANRVDRVATTTNKTVHPLSTLLTCRVVGEAGADPS